MTSHIKRRSFLAALSGGLAGCALPLGRHSAERKAADTHSASWELAQEILKNIKTPVFPKRDFSVLDFGANSQAADNTQAIKSAIEACHRQGGGRVVIPKGNFLTGPIHLLSNVNLHLEQDCRLLFSTRAQDYLPLVMTRWEGMELMGLSPLVYAYQQDNIAITGAGTLDGQADSNHWWPWKGGKDWSKPGVADQQIARAALTKDVENNTPVNQRLYGENAQLRPPFVQFYNCKNILIDGITITNSPFWLLNPVLSENITIRKVTCASLGPNSDGCDPESCKNVLIEDCFFDTGDDCIAIKSGRNADGRRINIPAENIIIRRCKMRNGHGGIVIGSEISGGARNIFAEDCEMSSPQLERGLRFKTNSVRGGKIENIFFRNITIGEVKTAIVVDFSYEEGDTGRFTPEVSDIEIRNLHCKHAQSVFNIQGYERSPIRHLHLINVDVDMADDIGTLKNLDRFIADKVTINKKQFSI